MDFLRRLFGTKQASEVKDTFPALEDATKILLELAAAERPDITSPEVLAAYRQRAQLAETYYAIERDDDYGRIRKRLGSALRYENKRDLWELIDYHYNFHRFFWCDGEPPRVGDSAIGKEHISKITQDQSALRLLRDGLRYLDRALGEEMLSADFRTLWLAYRCNCARILHDYIGAFSYAEALVNLEPNARAYMHLSKCYFSIGDADSAIRYATEAIKTAQRTDMLNAWQNRAEIHKAFGNETAYAFDQSRVNELGG